MQFPFAVLIHNKDSKCKMHQTKVSHYTPPMALAQLKYSLGLDISVGKEYDSGK